MSINSIKTKSIFLFFLLCNLFSTVGFCANADTTSKFQLVNDSSKTEIRRLSQEEQQTLLDSSDYQYDRIGPAPKSLWERFTDWFWRSLEDLSSTDGGKISLNILEYILIIAVIVIIIVLILKNDVRSIFSGKTASTTIDFKEFEEDIHTINFDDLIEESVSKRDFRKAVRLHFLKLLKDLTDQQLIAWKIDKTNNDYSIELSNSKYSSKFKQLVLLYEYIWYGDFQLDENNFKSTISKFKEFNSKE